MPRETFQQELDGLVAEVLSLGGEVGTSLENMVASVCKYWPVADLSSRVIVSVTRDSADFSRRSYRSCDGPSDNMLEKVVPTRACDDIPSAVMRCGKTFKINPETDILIHTSWSPHRDSNTAVLRLGIGSWRPAMTATFPTRKARSRRDSARATPWWTAPLPELPHPGLSVRPLKKVTRYGPHIRMAAAHSACARRRPQDRRPPQPRRPIDRATHPRSPHREQPRARR